MYDCVQSKDKTNRQSDVVQVLWEVMSGVAYIHARGVIHCDLKPDNIMLDVNNRPKVSMHKQQDRLG